MDATPIKVPIAGDAMRVADPIPATSGPLGARWSALHDAAAVVAGIAGISNEHASLSVQDFPEIMRTAGGWRHEHADQGIADLSAIMEPGLAALLTAHARGGSPVAAAKALWREFLAARDAILLLVPPSATVTADH